MYRCRICGREFETIPDQAILLNSRGQSYVYRIDGTVHDLHRVMGPETKHKLFHKKIPKVGCGFCFPPPEPEPPVEQEVVEASQLPEPTKQEVVAEPQVEDDEVFGLTPMQMALEKFRNRR